MSNLKVFINIANGFGDQYESILGTKEAVDELRRLGYYVEIYASCAHKYFHNDIDISEVFDFSPFGCDVRCINVNDIGKYINGHELINSDRKYMDVYCEKAPKPLLQYNPKRFGYTHFYEFGNDSILDQTFLRKDIIELSNDKFKELGDEFLVAQFRANDMLFDEKIDFFLNKENGHLDGIKNIELFVQNNRNKKIIVTSPNVNVAKYFNDKYDNVFRHEYKNKNLRLHNVYDSYTERKLDSMYIEHAKEILSEMFIFSKSIGMRCINTFRSNFLLYGLVHNIHHRNEKYKNTSILL